MRPKTNSNPMTTRLVAMLRRIRLTDEAGSSTRSKPSAASSPLQLAARCLASRRKWRWPSGLSASRCSSSASTPGFIRRARRHSRGVATRRRCDYRHSVNLSDFRLRNRVRYDHWEGLWYQLNLKRRMSDNFAVGLNELMKGTRLNTNALASRPMSELRRRLSRVADQIIHEADEISNSGCRHHVDLELTVT